MALTLHNFFPPTRSGWTFYVASFVLGLAALLQLITMGVFLVHYGGIVRHPAPPPISFAETFQPIAPTVETPAPVLLAAPTPAPAGALAESRPATLAPDVVRPTPAPSPANSANTLIDQARQLRQRGDMPSALARLREAQVAEPDNAQIIAEMALTYETLQLPDRAFEQWQRLYNMGDTVGALYYLADARLHAAPASTSPADPSHAASGSLAGTENGQSPFQENAVLKITDVHVDDVPDPAAKKVVLKIVVKNRPGTVIDPLKVLILVYFYDLIDGKDVVRTDAQTAYAWVTPKPNNWAGDKSEVLETTYYRPNDATTTPLPAPTASAAPASPRTSRRGARGRKAGVDSDATPAASVTPAPVHTYLGYIVRLYYDRQLQDDKADPLRLLQRFPSPSTPATD